GLSTGGLTSSNPLNRWPNRRCQGEIGWENGGRHALLPLCEDHWHVDAASLLVEFDGTGEALRGRTGGQVPCTDRVGDLDFVGGRSSFQRFCQDRRMAITAQRVLGQEWLAGLFLKALDEFLLAFYWPVGNAEQQPFEQFGTDGLKQFR